MSHKILFSILFFAFLSNFGFSEEKVYIILRGDTIYSIARSHGVSPQELLSHNGISDARTVQIGQRIRIPLGGAAAVSPAYGEYQAERNDTLYGIARRYRISLEELLDMNGFSPNYVLKAGEKIRVPASGQGIAAGSASSTAPAGSPAGGSAGGSSAGGSSAAELPGSGTAGAGGNRTPARVDPSVRWPVRAKEITYITGRLYGVQLTGEQRESVKSLTQGTVVSAVPYRGFGRVAIIQSSGGYLYVYGGCESLSVKEGDKVAPGAELGKLGIDAKSSKPQLFFFVYRSNKPVDPAAAPRA
jgi:murein DD-endopeptidase MepM/ murein hydrolase activator NlpD